MVVEKRKESRKRRRNQFCLLLATLMEGVDTYSVTGRSDFDTKYRAFFVAENSPLEESEVPSMVRYPFRRGDVEYLSRFSSSGPHQIH